MDKKQIPSDYGGYRIMQINSGDEFWSLIEELINDESPFYSSNRSAIAEAYKNGTLYGLKVNETDRMHKREARKDKLFLSVNNRIYLH